MSNNTDSKAYAAGYMIPSSKGDAQAAHKDLKLPDVRPHLKLEIIAPKVLLLTMNRPKKYNAMTDELAEDMAKAFDFFEREPSLWVAILTGTGKAFCGGQDLSIWLESHKSGKNESTLFTTMRSNPNPNGFGGMSMRRFKKPVIAAVNGGAHGGGCEMLLNVISPCMLLSGDNLLNFDNQCDMVITADSVKVSLPEPLRGVAAFAGGISRLYHAAGHTLAAEAMLTGRAIPATEARDRFRIVNYVVPDKDLMKTAVDWAVKMTKCSPDSLEITKEGMNMASYDSMGDTEVAVQVARHPRSASLLSGANCREGLESFNERREPRWKDAPILDTRQSKL